MKSDRCILLSSSTGSGVLEVTVYFMPLIGSCYLSTVCTSLFPLSFDAQFEEQVGRICNLFILCAIPSRLRTRSQANAERLFMHPPPLYESFVNLRIPPTRLPTLIPTTTTTSISRRRRIPPPIIILPRRRTIPALILTRPRSRVLRQM